MSKPARLNTFGCSAASAFFVLVAAGVTVHLPKSEKLKPRPIEVECR